MTTTSPNPAPEPPLDLLHGELTGPVKIRGRLRRLLFTLPIAYLGVFITLSATSGILLSLQIGEIDPAAKVANLGLVATLGAFFSMVAGPVAGLVSDRTRSRFGKRALWMGIGAVASGVTFVVLGLQHTLLGFAIAYCVAQAATAFVVVPLSAVLPDRVPTAVRGAFAASAGLATLVGATGGSVLASSFRTNLSAGYVAIAIILVVITVLFNVLNPDPSSAHETREPLQLAAFLRSFWVNPVKHPDFFWAFLGRFFLFAGYFGTTSYLVYILSDYAKLGLQGAAAAAPIIGLSGIPVILISTVVGGWLSDKLGRRKPIVVAATLLASIGLVVPIFSPTFTGVLVGGLIASLGFGAYQSVDTALMSLVLPNVNTFAKDLGVLAIASTLPQTLAPALAVLVIGAFHGYVGLYVVGVVLSFLGAIAILPIRSVR